MRLARSRARRPAVHRLPAIEAPERCTTASRSSKAPGRAQRDAGSHRAAGSELGPLVILRTSWPRTGATL